MKLRFIFFILFAQTVCFWTEASVEHIIERGETIESVAKLYGITPDDIIRTNPLAKDMFYAGMVLTIETDKPESSFSEIIVSQEENPEKIKDFNQVVITDNPSKSGVDNYVNQDDQTAQNEQKGSFEKGTNYFGFQIGYFFPKENKTSSGNVKGYSYGFSMNYSLRAGRYLIDNLFVELNAGFSLSSSSSTVIIPGMKSQEQEYTFYTIPLNFHIGYTLAFHKHFGINLYTGPMISFPVGSKYKVNDKEEKLDLKLKTTFDWDFGLELYLGGMVLGGRYSIAMNSAKGNVSTPKGVWMINLGYLF